MTASREMAARKKVVFPNLDGLRFLCFLAVFLFHGFHASSPRIADDATYRAVRYFFRHGDLGVNFFFVLSGFLITYLLLEEKASSGRIHVAYFYIRRILRIWPLYFSCIAFGFVAFPFLKRLAGLQPNETANPVMYLLFLSNFDVIERGLPDAGVLGVLWSVAVEEQFYLVWPLLLAVVPLGRVLATLMSIVAVSIAFRATQTSDAALTFHTLGLIGDMAVGGIAAHTVIHFRAVGDRLAGLHRLTIWGIYAIAGAIFLLDVRHLSPFDRLIPAMVFALIILEQNYARSSPIKLGSSRLLSQLGQRTYGMYCLHMIGNVTALHIARELHLGEELWHVLLLVPAVSFGITVLLSEASYQYLERPFLKLKPRFQFITRE